MRFKRITKEIMSVPDDKLLEYIFALKWVPFPTQASEIKYAAYIEEQFLPSDLDIQKLKRGIAYLSIGKWNESDKQEDNSSL